MESRNESVEDTENHAAGTYTSLRSSKRQRLLVPLVDKIKKEADDDGVLSTDNIIEITARNRKQPYAKVGTGVQMTNR